MTDFMLKSHNFGGSGFCCGSPSVQATGGVPLNPVRELVASSVKAVFCTMNGYTNLVLTLDFLSSCLRVPNRKKET